MPPPFNGQWGIFPFPKSRTIVASDIVNGLMVMRLNRIRDDDDDDDDDDGDDLRISSLSSSAATSAPATVGLRSSLSTEARAAAREQLIEYLKARLR